MIISGHALTINAAILYGFVKGETKKWYKDSYGSKPKILKITTPIIRVKKIAKKGIEKVNKKELFCLEVKYITMNYLK